MGVIRSESPARRIAGAAAACALLAGCGADAPPPPEAVRLPTGAVAPAFTEDGQWVMPARNYASTRFSGLTEITAQNVGTLRQAWTFETGTDKGLEAAPLVVGGTMYVVTPYPNVLFALDLRQPGRVKWRFEPRPNPFAQGAACCDVVNRGVAYANGRIFMTTLDGNAIAVHAETGVQVWRTQLADVNRGETITMAPLVVKNRVLVGNSGGEFGVRGWLVALDAGNGRELWRAYSTGPDADVLIGPQFRPFYEQDEGIDLGVTSWPPGRWQTGGGTVWGWISYDPALDLIFYGTANPGPWNHELRPGDNRWTAGIFARDPDDGAAHWFYQWSPHDLYDHDGVNENLLLELPLGGELRSVIVHPERNGYVYVLDRATGQVLSADPFVAVTASRGVDTATGRLIPNEAMIPRTGRVVRGICPASSGAKDWQPSAFSPQTGLVYIPHQNLCMDWEGVEANYIAGTPYVGANTRIYAGPGGHRGQLTAWDPVRRRAAWHVTENFPIWSGALATAGDVVFYGTMDGWFKAVDARTGAPLWQHQVASGIIGQPVSYRGPDGRQYVAVLAGIGGWYGTIVTLGLDARDLTAGTGTANAVRDLPRYTRPGGTLHVFALP